MFRSSLILKVSSFVLTSLFFSTTFAGLAKVDPVKSNLTWYGSKVSATHDGNLKIQSGSLQMGPTGPTKGEIVVDMTSLSNRDQEGKWNAKLVEHLKSPDFFDVEKHKTAILKMKSFKKLPAGEYEVSGDLVIKDISKPILFKTKIEEKGKITVATGELKFDRTTYDVKYNSGKFFPSLGDKLINDEIKVAFNIEAAQ